MVRLFCLAEGLDRCKFPKSISVAEIMRFCRYSKDRDIAIFKFMSEVRSAPLFIIEEQAYHTFRFDFRGESYLIPIFLEDRTIANVQQIFGCEDGDILIFF